MAVEYCEHCGRGLVSDGEICPYCDAPRIDNAEICERCGGNGYHPFNSQAGCDFCGGLGKIPKEVTS
jgi:predicted amidophosphoribosyltransferase